MKKTVVILVDNKKRDLPSSALIAYHLEKSFGINCELQPLEAWRACLASLKPDYILFNHLTASHLARFSKRLHEMGIGVGVLPNEGILYNKEVSNYNAGKYHRDVHIDNFFCWNEAHRNAILNNVGGMGENVHVVGVPRFDYYFHPWKRIFEEKDGSASGRRRPRILVCTNFVFAKMEEWPRWKVDKIFAPWCERISTYKNYREMIKVNAKSRERFFDFLNILVRKTKYYIDLKPHPSEDIVIYKRWHDRLTPEEKERVMVRTEEMIFELINTCDLEISCETCTTALEAWIAGKPTIELVLEKHPVFFHEEVAKCNSLCNSPEDLPGLVERTLQNPGQKDLQPYRIRHLDRWCDSPEGDSALKVAEVIASSISRRTSPKWKFTLDDRRRAIKLRFKNSLDLSYGSRPLRRIFLGWMNGYRKFVEHHEKKFIRPSDVAMWKEKITEVSEN